MPFCTACGNQIDEKSNFCANCGAKIKKPSTAQQTDPQYEEQQSEPVYGAVMTGSESEEMNSLFKGESDIASYESNLSEEKMLKNLSVVKKSRKKGIILAIINASLLIIEFLCTISSYIFIELGLTYLDILVSLLVVFVTPVLFITSIIGIIANKRAFNKPLKLLNWFTLLSALLLAIILLTF